MVLGVERVILFFDYLLRIKIKTNYFFTNIYRRTEASLSGGGGGGDSGHCILSCPKRIHYTIVLYLIPVGM